MSARGVVILALIAAGLAALLYYKPGKKSAPEFAISSLTPQDVKRVEIERTDKEKVVLELDHGQWKMSEPFAARADSAQVTALLSLLDAKSSVRYPQSDSARFDLERPLAVLTFNKQKMSLGAINPISGEQYLATEGYVYLVSPRHGSAAQTESWASRKLLAENEQPVRYQFPSFSVSKSGEQWSLDPAANAALAQEDFGVWVNRWQLATALRTEPASTLTAAPFKLSLAGGGEIPMAYAERDSEFLFIRQDEKLQYRFSPTIAKPLAEPPQPFLPK